MVKEMGIEPLGYLPYKKEAVLESRHLGLVTSAEVEHFQEKSHLYCKSDERNTGYRRDS